MSIAIIIGSSIGEYMAHPHNAAKIAVIAIVLAALAYTVTILDFKVKGAVLTLLNKFIDYIGEIIYRKETKFSRELEIGKINYSHSKVKIYRFLNDLIIDLGIKRVGITPFSFLLMLLIGSALVSTMVCELAFKSIALAIVAYPIILAGVTCILYTKANMAHDLRIEAVIEAENIISNSIKDGVVVSVRNSIHLIPEIVRSDFRDFLDNVTHKNYHIKAALMELNNNIGSVSDDFIKKCIEFEMQEEHGIVGMFKDVVELNNIKTELRNEMKRGFEKVFADFVIGATMIFVFLAGTIITFDNVANFYFNHMIGQIILIIDTLIVIGEFVYITYLRAKEL